MQERPGQIGDFWLSLRPGSAQWCRTWYDAGSRQTKRASLGTDDFQAAKLKLWEWFAKNGRLAMQAPQEASLDMVLVRYWEQHGRELASAEMTKIALGYWSDFFGACAVSDVTAAKQREFVGWLRRNKPQSDGYVKRILTVGKSALNRAYREGEIASVPFVLPGKDGPPRDRVLSLGESERLWAAAALPHERMLLAILYGALARPEAALDLRSEFYDPERRLLAQNPPGREQTRKYRPVVPVGQFLGEWLDSAPPGPLIHWHGAPVDSIKTAWRRMRSRAGLGSEVVAKTVRHTMATEMRAAGVPAAEIDGFLGHKAYSGRTEVYAKYRPDYLGQAVRVIDGYMGRLRASRVLPP